LVKGRRFWKVHNLSEVEVLSSSHFPRSCLSTCICADCQHSFNILVSSPGQEPWRLHSQDVGIACNCLRGWSSRTQSVKKNALAQMCSTSSMLRDICRARGNLVAKAQLSLHVLLSYSHIYYDLRGRVETQPPSTAMTLKRVITASGAMTTRLHKRIRLNHNCTFRQNA
jgi:hypothetical protein